ncbi:hypothetical protein, partial [Sphingobium wenxiniae]|uniref:hypothetical protein n=1 Tax=Sphingobium wenxiniae (strain DSM 21828 / CGMCC 1.7748 / JZ-1) TaxID=595605 RepID=UPI001C86ACE7
MPAGKDARRFAVFDVTEARRNDTAFFGQLNLSYSRRSVSGPLWAFAAAGCIARTTGIAGV